MKRREFLQATAAACLATTAPALPIASVPTCESLRIYTNGCDTVIAPSLARAKDIVSMIYHGKPLESLSLAEQDEYIDGPDGWGERTDWDHSLEIDDDVAGRETKTLRQWVADQGEGHLCIDGEYC